MRTLNLKKKCLECGYEKQLKSSQVTPFYGTNVLYFCFYILAIMSDLFLAPAVTVCETEGAMDSAPVLFFCI